MQIWRRFTFGVALAAVIVAWTLQVWPDPAGTACCSRRVWCEVLDLQLAPKDFGCGSSGENLNSESVQNDGLAVVKHFLKDSELASLIELYKNLPFDGTANAGLNTGYKSAGAIWDLFPALHDRVHNMTAKIASETTVKAIDEFGNALTSSSFMHTNASMEGSMKYPWHQDHDSFLQEQDHHNYLNFYIMIEKEHPREAGLDVVPWGALRSNTPGLYEKLVGGGATSFIRASEIWAARNLTPPHAQADEMTWVHHDVNDRCFGMSFNIGTLACTPDLEPGDALILRGDTIHRTQPHNSWRTSLSVRVYPAESSFSENKLMGSGAEALRRVSHMPDLYAMRALRLGKTHDTFNPAEPMMKFKNGGWRMWFAAPLFYVRFYVNYFFRKAWAQLAFIPFRDGSLPNNDNYWR